MGTLVQDPRTPLPTIPNGPLNEQLRIDNSRRGRIHGLWNISRSTKARTSRAISNERADYSAYLGVSGI